MDPIIGKWLRFTLQLVASILMLVMVGVWSGAIK